LLEACNFSANIQIETFMRLSVYSDYALRVLMHAALRSPDLTTIDDVAEAYRISRNHLGKVVHELSQKGYLRTRRGIGGGFTIGRLPSEICIGDVIRMTEQDEIVIDCVSRTNEPCAVFPACRLRKVLAEAAQAFYRALDQYTVADLVKRGREMRELLRIE
jgi:Rrf2 family transcriptional regulator, nitric oxide-sensitive transcriptional repressor